MLNVAAHGRWNTNVTFRCRPGVSVGPSLHNSRVAREVCKKNWFALFHSCGSCLQQFPWRLRDWWGGWRVTARPAAKASAISTHVLVQPRMAFGTSVQSLDFELGTFLRFVPSAERSG